MGIVLSIDNDELVARYNAKESVLSMSKAFGVSRGAITNRLRKLGLPIRGSSETTAIKMNALTKEERLQRTKNAHDAVRGVKLSHDQLIARANAFEKRPITSKYELKMAEWLTEAGISFIQQKAIGCYNVDIAITDSKVAIEIFGGHWHASGPHATRYRSRMDYLSANGWTPLVIWAVNSNQGERLQRVSAQYAISLHNDILSGKQTVTREHVIRGDGRTSLRATVDFNTGFIHLNEPANKFGPYSQTNAKD